VAFARVSQPRTRNGVLAADLTVSSLFPWAGNVNGISKGMSFGEGEQLSISVISAVTVTSDKTPRLLPQCEMPHAAGARSFRSLIR
jgi:hypothetical protein